MLCQGASVLLVALAATPEADPQAGYVLDKAAAIRSAVEPLIRQHGWQRTANPDAAPDWPKLFADLGRPNYVCFLRNASQAIYDRTLPPADQVQSKDVRVTAAPGQTVALHAAVRALQPLAAVNVRVETSTLADGLLQPGPTVRTVVNHLAKFTDGQQITWDWRPAFLLQTGPVDIPPETTQAFRVDLPLSPEAPAGQYSLPIVMTANSDSAELARWTVHLHVLPVRLDPAPQAYRFGVWTGRYFDEPTLRFLHDLGCRTLMIYASPGLKMSKGPDGKIAADWTGLDDYMQRLKRCGFQRGPHPLLLGGSNDDAFGQRIYAAMYPDRQYPRSMTEYAPDYYDHWVEAIRQLLATAQRGAWPEFWLSPYDAPNKLPRPQRRQVYTTLVQRIRADLPQLQGRIWTSLYRPEDPQYLADVADVWSGGILTPQRGSLAHEHAAVFQPYTVLYWRSDPALARQQTGFWAWRCGCDGLLVWAELWPSDEIYNDFDGQWPDWTCSFPTPAGPVPSPVTLALRDGLQDYLTVLALKKAVQQARARPGADPALQQAKALLDWVSEQFGPSAKLTLPDGTNLEFAEPMPAQQLQALREAILEATAALQAAPPPTTAEERQDRLDPASAPHRLQPFHPLPKTTHMTDLTRP